MSAQNTKYLTSAVPLIVALTVVQEAGGFASGIVTFFLTIAFLYLAGHFVWPPLLKKAGSWWSCLILGYAIVTVGIAVAVAGIELAGLRGIWNLTLYFIIVGLFLGWALAALRGAQDKKEPNHLLDLTSPSVTPSPGGGGAATVAADH
jgi:hypothetical protein